MRASRVTRAPKFATGDGPLPRPPLGGGVAGAQIPTTWISKTPPHAEHPFLPAFGPASRPESACLTERPQLGTKSHFVIGLAVSGQFVSC